MTWVNSDQPVHLHSLRVFTDHMCLLYHGGYSKRNEWYLLPYWGMYRLIWLFVGHTGFIVGFVMCWLIHFTTLWANSADDILVIFFLIFPRKWNLTFHANWKQVAWNVRPSFLKKKKNIFRNVICWNVLARVLSDKHQTEDIKGVYQWWWQWCFHWCLLWNHFWKENRTILAQIVSIHLANKWLCHSWKNAKCMQDKKRFRKSNWANIKTNI